MQVSNFSLNCIIDEASLCSSELTDTLLHKIIEPIIESRDTDHNRRLQGLEIVSDLQDVSSKETIL